MTDEMIERAQALIKVFEGSAIAEVVEGLIQRVVRAEDNASRIPTPSQVQEEAKRLFPDTEPLALSLAMREVFEKGAAFRIVEETPAAPVPWSGYTSHGHPIPGVPHIGKPTKVARCGGVYICMACRKEVSPYVPWYSPIATPYFIGNEKWCRHRYCAETNWGGGDRVHIRDESCPPVDLGDWLKDLDRNGIETTRVAERNRN